MWVDLITVLIFISLNNWQCCASFHMPISHLYVSSGLLPNFFLLPIYDWIFSLYLILSYVSCLYILDISPSLVMVVQLLSHVQLFATPWIAARQASLSLTNSWNSLRLMTMDSVMPSSHLILCCPLLLLPPIPSSISLSQWVNSSHEVAKVLEFQL